MKRLLLLGGLVGCGGTMQVDPAFGDTAAQAQGVREMRVYLGHAGAVRGLAVYHQDAALIPVSIRELGEKHFPGKPVAYYESEWHTGAGAVFEVEYDLGGGQTGEVSARADGTLLYVEQPLPLAEVPPAVQAAAVARVPGALVSAETKHGPQVDQIEVKIEHAGRTHVLVLTRAGEVVWHGLRFPAKIEVPVPLR